MASLSFPFSEMLYKRTFPVVQACGIDGAKKYITEFSHGLEPQYISFLGGGSGADLRGALNRIRAHTDRLNDTGWLGLEDGDSRVKIILIHVNVTKLQPNTTTQLHHIVKQHNNRRLWIKFAIAA